ncbi:MAG: TdeIII family type II restriction endonuclease [Candidatus Bathyarchaeia archaeon]
MKPETIAKIKNEIIKFANETLPQQYSVEELKRAFPFHSVFFTNEGLKAFKVQRTLVTRMGMKLYPKIALLIARDKYSHAFLNYNIEGDADIGMIARADRIIDELRNGRRKPNMRREWNEIISSASGEKIKQKVKADLFIGDYEGGALFMEIKSPRPNLDVCAESKKKMLYFKIINYGSNVEAYLAFPYNPFIYRKDYSHSFTTQIMDMENEVLIGEEMWDKIGGKGTFNKLLEILDQAREELKG